MYKLADKKFHIDENLKFVYDLACQGYSSAFEILSNLPSCQLCLKFSVVTDRALKARDFTQDTVSRGKDLFWSGYSYLDQDKDGFVSFDDVKKSSFSAYTFITSLSMQDLNSYKLRFFEKAIEHLKDELRAEELKDLKKQEWLGSL